MKGASVISLESEAGFRALFQYATVGILVIGKDGRIELANPCIEKLFGYSLAELIAQPVEVLIPEAFKKNHAKYRTDYFNKPQARPMGHGLTLYALRKDGAEFPVEISLGHYKLEGENLAVAFITDISARKKAEEELLLSKSRLNEEAESLKLLNDFVTRLWNTESLEEGIKDILESAIRLSGADKGNIQFLDPEKEVLHIVDQRGFDEEFLTYFKEVGAEDNSACGRAMKERQQVIVADTELEWPAGMAAIARKSGFRAVQSTPLIAHDGVPIGMISTHYKAPGPPSEVALGIMKLCARKAQSFLERHKMFETIQKHNQELEEKIAQRTQELIISLKREKELSEVKTRFVSMASHEFRTPLAAISSSISLIEAYVKEEHAPQRKKHTQRIKASVKNLVNILDEFLSLDKLEQSKVEVVNSVFDLKEFAEDVIEEMNGIIKDGQQIKLVYNGKQEITSDRKILKNVLLNLLSNGIKYSEKDIHLSIAANTILSIEIRDEGIGIPEEEQANLFSRFFRAKNAVAIQGTGLGLNIVKRYVDLLGGSISFTSRPNEGTTFFLSFPLD